MRVLVVDDDDFIRMVMVNALKSENYFVENSSSGFDAIEKLKNHIYDVVITDIVMPGKSGVDVAEHIKNNKLPTSILAISSYGTEEEMLEFANYFADDTLKKPFEKDDFLKTVKSLTAGSSIDSALLNM